MSIKTYIYIASAVLVTLLAWQAKRIWEQSNLYEQAVIDLNTCNATAVKTKEYNDALQADRDDTADKLAALKRMRRNQTITPRTDPIEAGTRPPVGNATVTGTYDDFIDLGGKCHDYWFERQRLEHALANKPR